MQGELDPQLLEDFLTEASELIEQLDGELVRLEGARGDEMVALLNGAFRALHTIKGAASFMALDALTTFTHAAEDALNRLRKGDVVISAAIIDVLLKSADVVRRMIRQLAQQQPLHSPPQDLMDQLHAIARQQDEPKENGPGCEASPEMGCLIALKLSPQKHDLLPFMAEDLQATANRIASLLESSASDAAADENLAQELASHSASLVRTAAFFDLPTLVVLFEAMEKAAGGLTALASGPRDELMIRLCAVCHLAVKQSQVLGRSQAYEWPCGTLLSRIESLAAGQSLEPALVGAHGHDITRLLMLDGVLSQPPAAAQPTGRADRPLPPAAAPLPPAAVHHASLSESTIRVGVDRLETLMNLAGQLVLSKNRILGLARQLRGASYHELSQEVIDAASELDRLTSELQMGVMRTRMQPLAKLFDRYPRVMRDMARKTGKQIDLQIVGRETEVDKSVLELLADPLVHLLRNSADHGLETAAQRKAAGKPAAGTIRILAEHQGSHVRVEVSDDGRGMDRQAIAAKAVERGLASADDVQGLRDEDVFKFIFTAGFSTAAKVTDLSGRGVGMDVVRTNVNRMGGMMTVQSDKDVGTTVEILIPLTVAVLPAMVVGVGEHLYALPLTSIVEIVRLQAPSLHTIAGKPVMTLRESVLPLIDLHARLDEPLPQSGARFAVVVAVGAQRTGLIVDRLIGQQDMVIKPLDDTYAAGGPFSGATIREDGDVSLILDIVQLLRQEQPGPCQGPKQRTAA